MNGQEALSLIDSIVDKPLNEVQVSTFVGCWEGKTYQEIASEISYDHDYIKDVGSKLWRLLSQKLGEKVTRCNFKSAIRKWKAAREVNSLTCALAE